MQYGQKPQPTPRDIKYPTGLVKFLSSKKGDVVQRVIIGYSSWVKQDSSRPT
jgi:hypothetical protein